MNVDSANGLLSNVRRVASPHHDERPLQTPIDMIVIHGISLPPGEFGQSFVEDFFCGSLDVNAHPYFLTIASLRVSAHIFINREGVVTQFVPFAQRAWHAGTSEFQGRMGCNDYSIGIELEGTDDLRYEPIQYQQLAHLIKVLMKAYPAIVRERIVGHVDIAPGRKTDPGPSFDWMYLDSLLKRSETIL